MARGENEKQEGRRLQRCWSVRASLKGEPGPRSGSLCLTHVARFES